jgi:hypothetical protein
MDSIARITGASAEQRERLADLISIGLRESLAEEDADYFLETSADGIRSCGLGLASLGMFGTIERVKEALNCENTHWPTLRERLARVMGFPPALFDEVDRLHHKERIHAIEIVLKLQKKRRKFHSVAHKERRVLVEA